jgi:hypothetical protein
VMAWLTQEVQCAVWLWVCLLCHSLVSLWPCPQEVGGLQG